MSLPEQVQQPFLQSDDHCHSFVNATFCLGVNLFIETPWTGEFYLCIYHQLRARRALTIFKDVPLRARRALSSYTLHSDSALLVLNGTSLTIDSALLALNWRYMLMLMIYLKNIFRWKMSGVEDKEDPCLAGILLCPLLQVQRAVYMSELVLNVIHSSNRKVSHSGRMLGGLDPVSPRLSGGWEGALTNPHHQPLRTLLLQPLAP